ncbi:HAMP domain-containing histidine kinase [Romeria aff. gracilis LEGE 07310]|uniref:histidine kinase n=1 Tax=Vasconcelosia minhoensis LEGE 07310 TaxID=915328 RepID=A0A8J7DBW2_9CYAN|nr:HAMP domain-containing sensor histidine kinase [Romeria gracilis]MBE9077018.1 HAMP domain-containing histidine kinase [Romeria aff. gracilis LEGE 07310]
MAQILILVEQSENRRLLAEYLKQYYEVTVENTVAQTKPVSFTDDPFDLCILDGRALTHLWEEIQSRKQQEQPVFLPVLLITSRPDVKLMTRNLWESIDELIARPIEKAELRVRVEMLLRSRRFSLQLSESLAREREQNELKSRFISVASHEFRSPLNMISGLTQLLETKQDAVSEKKADFLQRIQKAVKRMTTLLDDVLVMIKTEVNGLDLAPVAITLEPFCRKLIEEVKLSSSYARTVHVTYEGEHDPAYCDEVLLRQILTNLLSNALKYSSSDSVVQLQIQRRSADVVFQIQDQGIGISPEDQKSLFDAFYRAANVGEVSGTGLGLAIVKQAVDLHGGTISFSSEVNAGTTFVVTLPDLAHREVNSANV